MFKADDINQTTSKETKGVVVSKLEDVTPTGPQRIGLVAFFIGLPLVLYAGYLGLNYSLKESLPKSIASADANANARSKTTKDWIIPEHYARVSKNLFEAFESEKIKIDIIEPQRKSDFVAVPFKITNNTDKIVQFSIEMNTVDSEVKIKSYDRKLSGIFILPKAEQERSIKVFVPQNASNPAQKIVFVEAFLETTDGDTLLVKREYAIK